VHLKILLQSQQQVPINSTSYKGGGFYQENFCFPSSIEFPLIPLPIKEAVSQQTTSEIFIPLSFH
jgi:hypothetical protein